MSFHHLGIATVDGADLAATFAGLLDAPIVHEEGFDGMMIRFLELDGDYFELLEPRGDGPIARYLDRQGPGIHHVAVATDDIGASLERASDLGIDLVDEAPRPGAWGHTVAFLHPGSTGGVLVEFVASDSDGANRTV
ncbi:VOC family protein [Halobellus salinus]|uniref:VOC family protein n=1 Tax=Halobellus salinus TaxID=931585 RepID=UPI0016687EE2|nr:VOC family protein [Halobellus salinus]